MNERRMCGRRRAGGLKRIGWAAMLGVAAVLLVGCENKVTWDNFQKIQNGMSMRQVERILGSGDNQTASGGYGISSSGLLDSSEGPKDETWVWTGDNGEKIVLTFSKGQVVSKRQEGLEAPPQ